MLLLKLENYLITYLKWSLNTKQKAKQKSDKRTPALKLKPLALRGNCESATISDEKNRCLENRSNGTTNKRSSALAEITGKTLRTPFME